MEEPILKKRGLLYKIIRNQAIITMMTVLFVGIILIGSSYAILNSDDNQKSQDLTINVGNMQAVLTSKSEPYVFLDGYQKPVSDEIGMKQDGYTFSLINSGNSEIGYYEIRLVDQENMLSNLPHKYIRFSIKSNGNSYTTPFNLGDMDSIIYSGNNLDKGEKIEFNLKMWIDNSVLDAAYNKKLYAALEVTLYQKYNSDNYVYYDTNGGYNSPVRTNINMPITSIIPKRDGYTFLGWSTSVNGSVLYVSGSDYNEKSGMTLYAIWQ